MAEVESRFGATAVSAAGAEVLLQVMPTTARSLELSAGAAGAEGARVRYLRNLFDRFHTTDLALAADDAGPTTVARAVGAPTSETVSYLADVTQLWRSLNGC